MLKEMRPGVSPVSRALLIISSRSLARHWGLHMRVQDAGKRHRGSVGAGDNITETHHEDVVGCYFFRVVLAYKCNLSQKVFRAVTNFILNR